MPDPNIPIPTYPTSEPTSALDFADLITEVAYKIGCASYGEDGTGAPAPPTDTHDLVVCKRIVNKAIRMFINDGPPNKTWRFLNPIAQVDLWPQISADSNPNPTYYVNGTFNASGPYAGCTTLVLSSPGIPTPTPLPVVGTPAFYQSMELRQIFLNGNPPPSTPGYFPYQVLNSPLPVSSITRSGGIATATTSVPHGLNPGETTSVYGAIPANYNGVQLILTVPTPTTFTYAVLGSPTTPATAGVNGINELPGAYAIGDPYTILYYINANTVVVDGPLIVGYPTNIPFSFASPGDYTLPANFGGEYTGGITYIANTNRGMVLSWVDEFQIRSRRQNYNIESGTPYWAAVRIMPTPSYQGLTNASGKMTPRRRWELMTWRIPSEFLSVIFPYTLSFNDLVNFTDITPAPFSYDETIKAACLAVAEKEVEDTIGGPDWTYYHQQALPQAYRIDDRAAPKAIGYFGNPALYYGPYSGADAIRNFRGGWYQRPTVPVYGPGPGQIGPR